MDDVDFEVVRMSLKGESAGAVSVQRPR
jgi:hypothetical protein